MKYPTRLMWLLAIVAATSLADSIEKPPEPPMLKGGKYLIYVPHTGHMEEDLVITASVFNATQDTHITIELQKTHHGKNHTVILSHEDDIKSDETKLLKLPIPIMVDYNFKLVVNGSGGVDFSDSVFIYISPKKSMEKSYHIFIQTDKPVYKPLDKVRFRVFGLHADLRASNSSLNITMIDPNSNIMFRWFNETSTTGVNSHEYELSDKPVMGRWTIEMHQEGKKERYYFEVKEYVLPNYKVEIHGDKNIPSLGYGYLFIDEKSIKVNVTAKYTFGSAVRGKLFMNATIDGRDDGLSLTFQKEIDGESHIEFNMKNLTKTDTVKVSRYQRYCTPRSITFKAMVVEALTGKKMYSEPFSIDIVNAPVKVDIDTPIVYKRGLPKKVKITVSRLDKQPLSEKDRELPLEVTTKHGNGLKHYIEHVIPLNGSVLFDFMIPVNKEGSVTIEVKYKGHHGETMYEITEMAYPGEFRNSHEHNIEAILLQERVTMGDDIKLLMNSTTPISKAIITTISHHKILSNKMMDMGDKTTFVVEIPTTEIMIPSASVIVTCITSEGKLMVDANTAKITIAFQNDVVGTFTKPEGHPGTNVDFKVKTMPGSAVFVMAVDKKVHLLEEAKYITEDMVYDALVGADTSNYWRRNVRDIRNTLRSVGLDVLTNYFYGVTRGSHYNSLGRTVYEDKVVLSSEMSPMGPVPVASNAAPPKRVRSFFPETWIWQEGQAGDSGEYTFSKTVPDSITMWEANAFAFHPEKGLGIMKEHVEFLSHEDFFILLDLPYSLIRGETFTLKVSVFSNLTTDQEVTVKIAESPQFKLNGTEYSKKVMLKSFKDNTVQFQVTPTEVGDISFKIRGECAIATDEMHKSILVKPEGYTQYKNKAFLLKVADETPVELDYEFTDKPEIVPDSERIEVSVIGDIMGPSIDSLGHLIRIPYGCGEQNMINFAPNIYIYNYLNATSKLTPEHKKKIEKYTISGYKNQMKYQLMDGSYSAFGKSDKKGSTWLTAFVLRCFGQARKSMPELYIDEEIISDGVSWLVRKRTKENLFSEDGKVIHSAMQGGASKGVALTTYVLISLFENNDILPNVTKPLIEEVAINLPIDETDTYSLAMMMYLMALIKDTDKFATIEKVLEEKAMMEDDMKYWKTEDKTEGDNYYHSASTGIELSSYVLLAYTEQGMVEKAIPVMKWLMAQRNSLGGFHSTQDTVLGLESLSMFAAQVKSPETLSVTVSADGAAEYTFPEITPLTSTILHKHVMPADSKKIHMKSVGKPAADAKYTYALAQVSWQYNIKFGSKDDIFEAKVHYDAIAPADMELEICHRVKKMNLTGMIIVEASLPSGHSLTNNRELLVEENVSKVELEDSKVVLYLKEITTSFSCYTLKASKVYEIQGHLSPLPVKISLYYQPDLELVTMYQITGGSE